MNKEYNGAEIMPDSFPLDVENLDDTVSELATLYQCQELELDDIPDDLVELL